MTYSDPVYTQLCGSPTLDGIRNLYPRLRGSPAFDPDAIEQAMLTLKTLPEIATGHPLLDRSVKVGLVSIDATFEGDHPKYGVGAS